MSSRDPKTQARVEAVVWFATLGLRRVTNEQVRKFSRWRENPTNDAVYRELEREARQGPRTLH